MFTQTEYLISFASIIYGFTAAEYFHGWGSLQKLNKLHLNFILWSLLGLFFLIDIWWGSWIRVSHLSENILYFFLSLTTPVILYLQAILSFPNRTEVSNVKIHNHFRKRFRKVMILYVLTMVSILANNFVFSPKDFFRFEITIMLITTGLCVIGCFAKSKSTQNAVLAIGYALLIMHLLLTDQKLPENIIQNYSQSEYLHIFLAIVYGYVASVFFTGWGTLMRKFKMKEVHLFHLLWTIFAFIIFVDIWWSTWNKIDKIPQNIGYFYLLIAQPFLYYFLAVKLFSVLKHKRNLIGEKFMLASPSIFFLFAATFIFNIIISLFFHELELFDSKNIFRIIATLLAFIGAYKQSSNVQTTLLFISYITYLTHIIFNEGLLNAPI